MLIIGSAKLLSFGLQSRCFKFCAYQFESILLLSDFVILAGFVLQTINNKSKYKINHSETYHRSIIVYFSVLQDFVAIKQRNFEVNFQGKQYCVPFRVLNEAFTKI